MKTKTKRTRRSLRAIIIELLPLLRELDAHPAIPQGTQRACVDLSGTLQWDFPRVVKAARPANPA